MGAMSTLNQSVDLAHEIDGVIRVYQDGHVERPQIVPCVTPSLAPDLGVTCVDTTIDSYANLGARVYAPDQARPGQLPLLIYFHGGGFCVGSPSWGCYHAFLAKLASGAHCAVVSVGYRLAPENPLPAAYDDGVKAVGWARQQAFVESSQWWARGCDFGRVFLGGDSAGGNIAYNVAARLRAADVMEGLILIQPFFGGERRTHSEQYMAQPPRSALTLAASDAYWRLALPAGADRDHPWCNPPAAEVAEVGRGMGVMVCLSEMDILRDRNLELCSGLAAAGGGGRRVEKVVSKDVGHAFQILGKSGLSEIRVHELICRVKDFLTK